MGITELADRVRAGLLEDERVARVAGGRAHRHWVADFSGIHPDGTPSWPVVLRHLVVGRLRMAIVQTSDSQSQASVLHMARHDPARILADVAAKRRLLDQALGWPHDVHDDSWYTCPGATEERDGGSYAETDGGGTCDCGRDARVLAILQLLAQPYQEKV